MDGIYEVISVCVCVSSFSNGQWHPSQKEHNWDQRFVIGVSVGHEKEFPKLFCLFYRNDRRDKKK